MTDFDARPIAADVWHAARQAHERAVETRTSAHLERRARGEKHPVEDFLFTYYPFKPAKLAKWHPGAGRSAVLSSPADREYFDRRWYRITQIPAAQVSAGNLEVPAAAGQAGTPEVRTGGFEADAGQTDATGTGIVAVASVDIDSWLADRGEGARFIQALLEATLNREATLGCFGLHEWAMVYQQTPEQHRHSQVPLRLSQEETDRVVETHRIQCSHFDAFRFFTPPARPLNTIQPTRAGMRTNEQPGCLHSGMDLYKWAMKLEPIVGSETVLKCFDLALDIRTLDMEASPYDVRGWGYGVVAIETAAGKAEYMDRQKAFSERAQALRAELLDWIARAGV